MRKLNKFEKTILKLKFEDIYNPMRVYAYLRYGMEIPRVRAQELADWYENKFYKKVIEEHNEKTKNKLESNLHSDSRHSYP